MGPSSMWLGHITANLSWSSVDTLVTWACDYSLGKPSTLETPQENSCTCKQGDSGTSAYPGKEPEAAEEGAEMPGGSQEELARVTESITDGPQSRAQSKPKKGESRGH